MPAGSVTYSPESLIVSPFYGYGPGGYFPADTLLPGEGYWVKCRDSGWMVPAEPPAMEKRTIPRHSGVGSGRLTVRAGSSASTLFFGPGEVPGLLESPPPPPGGSTLASFKGGEIGVIHESYPKYPVEHEILVNTPQSEIFFSWAVESQENLEYILVEIRSGREISKTLLRGSGASTFPAAPGSKFLLRVLPRGIENSGTPAEFSLGEWYPNPFNPLTHILLALPFESSVTFTVFNLLGEKVSSSAQSRYPAGEHLLEWRAERNDGIPLGSGVYFIALTAVPVNAGPGGEGATFRSLRKVVFVR